MPVLTNIGRLATCRAEGGQGAIHAIDDAAVAFREGVVSWVGPARALPASQEDGVRWDAGGRLVVPGLVDAHTHLAFGGWRFEEHVRRIEGASYAEIAAAGGGIASTVDKTRAAGEETLCARARGFVREMAALGVTTAEAKSGYGLDRETELALLRVYRKLDAEGIVRIVPTYLGAHVVPPEHRAERERYLRLVVDEMIPLVAAQGLARFCDVFVEKGAFTVEEARRIVTAARAAGLGSKLHADQLGTGAGAMLAAELGAVSADHLEHVSPAGIAALAQSGTVAVILPIAALYLGGPPAPARALIEAGVPVAIATDFNPGTAPSLHLPFALTLACLTDRLTPAEALKGATLYAARALELEKEIGSVEPGKAADLAVIDATDENEWLLQLRANACLMTVKGGRITHRAPASIGETDA